MSHTVTKYLDKVRNNWQHSGLVLRDLGCFSAFFQILFIYFFSGPKCIEIMTFSYLFQGPNFLSGYIS